MDAQIVILAGKSLFMEGLISRLRQTRCFDGVEVINLGGTDPLPRVLAASPSTIIFDETDPDVAKYLNVDKLLSMLPRLKVICLDPRTTQTRIIHWEPHSLGKIKDLLDVIGFSTQPSMGLGDRSNNTLEIEPYA